MENLLSVFRERIVHSGTDIEERDRGRSLELMKKLILIVALMINGSVSAQTWRADNGDGTFTNPLFYDEFSDPDLIRVGEDYFITGTTMHSMPGLPVLHSRDLVNWKLISYALSQPTIPAHSRIEKMAPASYGRRAAGARSICNRLGGHSQTCHYPHFLRNVGRGFQTADAG